MSDQKKFKVIGVGRNRPFIPNSLEEYARDVEHAMNKLSDDGYNVGLRDEEDGVVIIGELPEDISAKIEKALACAGFLRTDEAPSHRTGELIARFARATNGRVSDVALNAESCTTGFSVSELESAAATECQGGGVYP
jgi:hypothetical protein